MLPPMAAASRRLLTRNTEAPWLFESFFIAAVASFLGIRWFLALTGYPRLGTNGLHIAHMLWGGLLMLVAVLLLIGYVDRSVRQIAVVVAGLGFGTFIDEIGKFVTADNDYFFRPAVALVYVAFVGAFLVARAVVGRRQITQSEAQANALYALAGLSGERLGPSDRSRIARLLALSDPADPGTKLIQQFLADQPKASVHVNWLARIRVRLGEAYERVMANPLAEPALTVLVVGYAILAVASVGVIVATSHADPSSGGPTISGLAQLLSTVAGAALVGLGVVILPRSRIGAFRWMERGVLVWILVTQVFVFYSSQLAGLSGLVVDLAVYAGLRFAIGREIESGRDRARSDTAPP